LTTTVNATTNATRDATTNGRPKQPDDAIAIDWEALARSVVHPLRMAILEILGMDGGRRLLPTDMAFELQLPLSNVNYAVAELAKAQLIELVRTRAVRGATEHFYVRAKPSPQPTGALVRIGKLKAPEA
jgi:hypothetical protein